MPFTVREPVRTYIYAVLVPIAAAAVLYGLLSAEQATAWLTIAAAILGIGIPATELARSKVTPVAAPNLPGTTGGAPDDRPDPVPPYTY